jgi:hypothetical protein
MVGGGGYNALALHLATFTDLWRIPRCSPEVRRSASSIAANPSTMPLPTGALVADHGLLFVRTHDHLPLRRAGFLAVRRDLSPRGRNVRAVIGSHSEFGKTCSGVRLATQARASQRVQRGTK